MAKIDLARRAEIGREKKHSRQSQGGSRRGEDSGTPDRLWTTALHKPMSDRELCPAVWLAILFSHEEERC